MARTDPFGKATFPREIYSSGLRTGLLVDPESKIEFSPVRVIGSEEVKVALQDRRTAIVILNDPSTATDGSISARALQWHRAPSTYSLWKDVLQERLVSPQQAQDGYHLDDFEGGYCFTASEWRSVDGQSAILFEKHH